MRSRRSSPPARSGHDRAGSPRAAAGRLRGRRQGAAAGGGAPDPRRPRAARAVRGEGGQPPGLRARGRPARSVRVPLGVAAARARLLDRGREHRAHPSAARRVRPPQRAARPPRALDPPAARDAGGRRRQRARGRTRGGAPRGGAPAALVLLPAGPRRGVLPRRPAPGQPALGRRPGVVPRLRHGRRAGARRPPAPAAARDGVLARRRAVPGRDAAHALGPRRAVAASTSASSSATSRNCSATSGTARSRRSSSARS